MGFRGLLSRVGSHYADATGRGLSGRPPAPASPAPPPSGSPPHAELRKTKTAHFGLAFPRSHIARMGICRRKPTPQLCIMHYALCIEKALCILNSAFAKHRAL